MKIHFLKLAENELDEAVRFYEAELSGLGDLFKGEVQREILRIKDFPCAYWLLNKRV